MLQALNQQKKIVTLAALSKSEIQAQRMQSFFCPVCRERVIIKAGMRMIPHFAHQRSSSCPANQRGEGAYHERGKLQLFRWLKRQFPDVTLETYLQDIKQRPDILLRVGKRKIAIEYQCAKIPLQDIIKRNKNYRFAGIQPIWILGANLFQRKGKSHFHVNPFILTFLHQFHPSQPTALYFYCPETNTMIQAADVFLISLTKAVSSLSFSKLDKIRFANMFHHVPIRRQELFHIWMQEKKSFRLRNRFRATGKEQQWRQWLYQQHATIDILPAIVYLPIPSAFGCLSPLWDWQSRICLGLLRHIPVHASFTTTTCINMLQNHLQQNTNFPMIQSLQNPITEYLALLCRLQVIKEDQLGHFRKIKDIRLHDHFETALLEDKELLHLLMQRKNSMNNGCNHILGNM